MTSIKTSGIRTLDMMYIALFTVLLTICSWISIPTMIPFTMQTFGVFLTIGVLGGKRAFLALLTYMLLGIIGIPVFAGFSGGIHCILGCTGGYFVGFLFSALAAWTMERLFGESDFIFAVSMILGILICYAFGTFWFMFVYAKSGEPIGLWATLGWCVFPYLVPDMLKMWLAFLLRKRIAALMPVSEGGRS